MNLLASVHTPHVFHRIHLMPYLDPTDPATVIYRPKRVPLKMVQYSRINSHVAMVYNHTQIGSFPRGGLSGGLRCISSRRIRPHYFRHWSPRLTVSMCFMYPCISDIDVKSSRQDVKIEEIFSRLDMPLYVHSMSEIQRTTNYVATILVYSDHLK